MIELDDEYESRGRTTVVSDGGEIDNSTKTSITHNSENHAEGLGLLVFPFLIVLGYGSLWWVGENVVLPAMEWMNTTMLGNIVMALLFFTFVGIVDTFLEE